MRTLTRKKSTNMLKSLKLSALFFLTMMITLPSFGQIFAPEGLNMPGAWNGYTQPPAAASVFLGDALTPGGGITLQPSGIYQTTIEVSATGDTPAGNYSWLFTSNGFGNKWANIVPVNIGTIQTYSFNSGPDNNVTLADNRWYTVNFENTGYTDTRAIFMETSANPVAISSVSQLPAAGSVGATDVVAITATLSGSASAQEIFYLRYAINGNFAGSPIVAMTGSGTTRTANIPAQVAATGVAYYIFSSTVVAPAPGDADLVAINTNTNGGSNYNYTVNAVSNWDITFRVNMQNETVGGNVYLAGNFNGFSTSADPMTETAPGSGIYEITKTLAQGYAAVYKFTNGASFEGNIGAPCGNGNDRTYTVGSADATLPTVCFSSCNNCLPTVNVTFQVNMNNETVGGNVYWASNSNGFSTTADPMTETVPGSGIYTITKSLVVSSVVFYKFTNGASFEGNIGAPCGNGTNRTYTVPATASTIPVACFGSCTNCTSPVNVTFRVNMANETAGVVSVSGSFNGFNTTANIMTETIIGSGIYTATVSILSGTNITYKYVNDGGYEGNLGAPCGNGADRTYTVPASAVTLPLVCFSSCNNCAAPSSTWTSVASGNWNNSSIWDQGSVPPVGAAVVIASTTIVTLNTNASVSNMTIASGGTFIGSDGLNRSLTIETSGFFSNSGILNSTSTFSLVMSGGNTIFGNPGLNDLILNGGLQIAGNTFVNGDLILNPGGFFNGGSSPSYGANATLIYSTGGTYGRGLEWNGLTDYGYPRNVQISNNTILQPGANSGQNIARAIAGNLTIDAGSSMFMDWGGLEMTQPIAIGKNLILNGSLSLSSQPGGDISIGGNFTFNSGAVFNANNRSVAFTGLTSQNLNGSALSINFAFLTKNGNSTLTLNLPTTIQNDLFVSAGTMVANADLTLQNGGTLGSSLRINSGRTLFVTGGTLNANGSLIIESAASLMHGAGTPGGGGAVAGSVRVVRNGQTVPAFNFWSSPVAGANSSIIGAQRYLYDPASGTQATADDSNEPGWIPVTGPMTVGRGYASSNGGVVNFAGTANNGSLSVGLVNPGGVASRFNLIGNPYPSAISVNDFLNSNGPSGSGIITGSLYLWDDDNSLGAGYAVQDYVVLNAAGYVSGGNNVTPTPSGVIGSGQGFFVEATFSGNAAFINTMRRNTNTQFFQDETIRRVRLSITNEHDDYNETLIAFINDATEGVEGQYDARKLSGNPNISFFSKINGEAFAIQGLPDSFENRIVDLGYQYSRNENHTISLVSLELIPSSTMIYLEDRETGEFINLRANNSYTFMPGTMSSDDRFALHFSAPIEALASIGNCESNVGTVEIVNPSAEEFSYVVLNSSNNLIAQGAGSSTSILIDNLNPDNYTIELTMNAGYLTAVQTEVSESPAIELYVNASSIEVNSGEFVSISASSNGSIYWFINNANTAISSGNDFTMNFSEAGIYNITARASNGICEEELTTSITVRGDITTSIADASGNAFTISPNPAEDFARITLPENFQSKSVTIELVDVTGKLILSEIVTTSGNTIVLPLNNVESGMYLITLTSNANRSTSRIIVK
ncbi:MAG: T9SS type A sorting domain-containing protein [Bacteroidia bacterium]